MGTILPPRVLVAPVIVNSISQATEGRDIVMRGQYIYSVSMSGIVYVIDKSNPESLVIVGSVSNATTLNGAHGIALNAAGTLACVACNGGNRLTVVDISTPASPSIVGSVQDNTALLEATDVEVSGNYAFVSSTGNNGITVVDFSTPATPAVVASVTSATLLINPQGIKMNVAGTRLYAGNRGSGFNVGLTCVDVSTPLVPAILGSGRDDPARAAVPSAVDLDGNYAYTTTPGSANRMDVWEIANLATGVPHNTPIWRVGVFNSNLGLPLNCRVKSGFVYVPGQSDVGVFSVIDVQDPLVPFYLTTVYQPTPGSGAGPGSGELYHNFGCFVDEAYAFVSAHGGGRCTSLKLNRNYGEYCEAGNGPRIA